MGFADANGRNGVGGIRGIQCERKREEKGEETRDVMELQVMSMAVGLASHTRKKKTGKRNALT